MQLKRTNVLKPLILVYKYDKIKGKFKESRGDNMSNKNDYTYNQSSKKIIRHKTISYAIKLMTSERERACCVERNYVRNIYDFYNLSEEHSLNKVETQKIDVSYITNWERLHDSYIGNKRPEDLTIAYLSGPEPENDFREFLGMGILPQNIWGFEINKDSYKKAITAYRVGEFPQPRIIKQNIETFFQQTPKKFDIIYIDACGSIPSSQHALRCIATACQYHRLNSPGVFISNFAEPDINKESIAGFCDLISQYLFFKKYPYLDITFDKHGIANLEYIEYKNEVETNFKYYYSEFISALLRDIPAIIIPLQRFAENPYLNQIFDKNLIHNISIEDILKLSKGNSLASYFFAMKYLATKNQLGERNNIFLKELINFESLILGLKIVVLLRKKKICLQENVKAIESYFEEGDKVYRFLDRPHSNMLFDVIINQLSYPLHYNVLQSRRFQYKAKYTNMFTDVSIYDECRYIYEWIPALHQITSAFDNVSWQYVFRFALDGLVKMRQAYNNEFFYQGSVISNSIKGFEKKKMVEREIIE